MKDNEFKCGSCGGIFEMAWSEKESKKEAEKNWGEKADIENMAIICDDCYKILMPTLLN